VLGDLERDGFVVLERPCIDVRDAYDHAVATSDPDDVSVKSCTRARNIVNRGACFDRFWLDEELLHICQQMFTRPFKLGSFLARAVNPGGGPQDLHVDRPHDEQGTTLVGFLWMIDEFRRDNGATQFVPGSHRRAPDATRVVVTGPRGTLVVYDGAVWHGYTRNHSNAPRRSLQGAFILRDRQQDHPIRLLPETAARLDRRALDLLGVDVPEGSLGRS
jgi:ectoine hydroxylase-related dioxygenase (phytanoyl-CoA dioxygenase family)